MNNQKVIQEQIYEEKQKARLDAEVALNNANSIIRVVKNLKENPDYLGFKKLVLDPSIDLVKKRIERNLKDLVNNKDLERQILQDQGMVTAFRKFSDFDEIENIYNLEVERITKLLKK